MSTYQHLLVAIDFSPAADAVMKRALEVMTRNKARLTLLHVVEYLPPMDIAYEPVLAASWQVDEKEMLAQARSSLEKLAAQLKLDKVNLEVSIGSPKLEICQYARDHGCDLVILGSHGRHGLKLLLGSTANGVLHDMPCDVLAVKVK